jgi:hypothetical protein
VHIDKRVGVLPVSIFDPEKKEVVDIFEMLVYADVHPGRQQSQR